jgi:O-antigen ligase
MVSTRDDTGDGFLFRLLLIAICAVPLLILPVNANTPEDIYLIPRVIWIYVVVLPLSLALIWKNHKKIKFTHPWVLMLILWVGFLIVSGLSQKDISQSFLGSDLRMDGVSMHVIYAVVALASFCSFDIRELASIKTAFIFVLVLLIFIEMLQFYQVFGTLGSELTLGVTPVPPGATLGNRGYLGGLLAMLVPFAVDYAVHSPFRGWVLIVASMGVAATLSRGAWGAAVLTFLIFFLATRAWKAWWLFPCILVGIAIPVIFPSPSQLPELVGGLQAKFKTDASGRNILWNSAWYGIKKRPLFGWGADGILAAMRERPIGELTKELTGTLELPKPEKYKNVTLRPDVAHAPLFFIYDLQDGSKTVLGVGIDKVHNEYLDYAVSYGISSAVFFVFIILWAIHNARSTSILGSFLIAYLIYLLTWPEVVRFAPLAWFIIGASASINIKGVSLIKDTPLDRAIIKI